MRSSIKIMDTLFGILNVDQVTDLLDGGLFRHKAEEDKAELTNVVLIPLTNPKADVVQEGTMNVNVFAPPLSDKSPDEEKLQEIFEAIDTAISGYSNTTNYYNFELSSESLVSDERDRTYLNIRVRFYIET